MNGKIAQLKGTPPPRGDPSTPFFPDDADLSVLSQAVLEAEMARLEKLVSADKETQRQYSVLSNRIAVTRPIFCTNRSESLHCSLGL